MVVDSKLRECEDRIARMRRAVLRSLQAKVKPRLRACGYSGVQICVLSVMKDGKPEVVTTSKRVPKAKKIEAILGFYQDGVILDVDGHAMLTEPYYSMPLEDLIAVSHFFDKHKEKLH